MNVTARRLQLIKAGYCPIPLFGKVPPTYGKNNTRKGLTRLAKAHRGDAGTNRHMG
jgi:hypothetical protein